MIKNQALISKNEIYGWLIGFQKNNIPYIVAIIECKRFILQSLISAIPNAQEFHEISSVMPQGIGPIGIYHSHPFSSLIFHSHTDDSTLLSLSGQFPNCISIVTNGKEIKCFHIDENKNTIEARVESNEVEIPKFLIISLNEEFEIFINKMVHSKRKDIDDLKIKILNKLSAYIDERWDDIELFIDNLRLLESDSIKNFLHNELDSNPIQLKFPNNEGTTHIFIDEHNQNKNMDLISNKSYKLNINLKIPIYIENEYQTFHQVKDSIKTELISNNLLQKLYNCILDYNDQIILIPEDYFLKFFGFYIRFLYFKNELPKDHEFSRKFYQLTSKIISIFNAFEKFEFSEQSKNHIKIFFEDLKNYSHYFKWYDKIIESIKYFKTKLNINA
ncbi:MAG: hypothetical protein ACFFAO_02920 [Candidatus Hermodarchaeota archaeon]